MAVWTSTSIVRAHVRLLWQIRVEQRTQENNSSPEVTCVPTEPHTHLLERLDRDEPLPNKLGVQTPRERDQRPNTWLWWKYRRRHCCLHSFNTTRTQGRSNSQLWVHRQHWTWLRLEHVTSRLTTLTSNASRV